MKSEIPIILDDELVALLRDFTDDELAPLVELVVKQLTSQLDLTEQYRQHSPKHSKYSDLLAAELQKFGANTFATVFRKGRGVYYRVIVQDVAKSLKLNVNLKRGTDEIEIQILLKVLENAWEKMSEAERAELLAQAGVDGASISASFPTMAVLAIIKAGGFASYKIMLIVVNAVCKLILGRGLPLAANAALAKCMGVLAGPIGWAITIGWALVDIAGPAYRVTVPAVIHIAAMRQIVAMRRAGVCDNRAEKSA